MTPKTMLAALLALAAAAPVQAQGLFDSKLPSATAQKDGPSRLFAGVTGAEMTELMKAWGYVATLTVDKDGDPEIASAAEGVKFHILFYGCMPKSEPRRCTSYQFAAAFRPKSPALEPLNAWNDSKRQATASIDGRKTVMLRLNVNAQGGIVEDNMRNWLEWWTLALRDFKAHLGSS